MKKVSTTRQKRNPSFVLEPRVFQKESNNRNFASGHARHLILVSNPRFLGMANHLGPFSGASDQPEGQELGVGAVGGQEGLQDVKF